jgi:hypothetical protein
LEEGEYVHFLATLFHRITRVRTWLSRTGQVMCKYVWQKQRKVKSSLAYRPYMTKEQRDEQLVCTTAHPKHASSPTLPCLPACLPACARPALLCLAIGSFGHYIHHVGCHGSPLLVKRNEWHTHCYVLGLLFFGC